MCRFFYCIKKITIEVTAGAPSLPMHFDDSLGVCILIVAYAKYPVKIHCIFKMQNSQESVMSTHNDACYNPSLFGWRKLKYYAVRQGVKSTVKEEEVYPLSIILTTIKYFLYPLKVSAYHIA